MRSHRGIPCIGRSVQESVAVQIIASIDVAEGIRLKGNLRLLEYVVDHPCRVPPEVVEPLLYSPSCLRGGDFQDAQSERAEDNVRIEVQPVMILCLKG